MAAISSPDGKPVRIALADGRTVTLQGLRRAERASLSAAQCAITIDGRRVGTMGVAATDAYTCIGLVAAGTVPPKGAVQRIGLIYDVASPNTRFPTAVILEESDGGWLVDETLSGEFDGADAGRSMAGLRRALKPPAPRSPDYARTGPSSSVNRFYGIVAK